MKLRGEGGAQNWSMGTTVVIFLSYINDSTLRSLLKLGNVPFDFDPNADCRNVLSTCQSVACLLVIQPAQEAIAIRAMHIRGRISEIRASEAPGSRQEVCLEIYAVGAVR
jgi:hypothetical protein